MAKESTFDDSKKTVETVQKLLALAEDESNAEEARTAAVKAIRLMKEHDLKVVSGAQLDAAEKVVAEARALVAESKRENRQNLFVGGLMGYLLSKGGLFK
jgi:hypothetical protein